MTAVPPGIGHLPFARARLLDQLCDRFEAAWRAGPPPRVEDCLADAAEAERPVLLRELLALELSLRQAGGAKPTAEEYLARFPDQADVVRALFAADQGSGAATSPTPSAAAAPRGEDEVAEVVLGDYELLGRLGAGGMGVVYRARQRSANRVVALKLIRPDWLEGLGPGQRACVLQRFRTEAEAAARLEHDHIVTVYEVGTVAGRPFYSMRYVPPGRTLADVLADGPVANRAAARYLEPVARALHYAHTRGVVHRDVKPRNVLVRDDGQTFLTDFGLAKQAGGGDMTRAGEWLGTPFYLAPEQARDSAAVTGAADVYALGATLYHLLTGRPPFRAATEAETLLQLQTQEPVPPRRLNPAIARDLETVCLKCLEKEPGRRYASAEALADDLARFLRFEPIRARPPGPAGRLARFCRRKPAVAALTGLVAVLLLTLLGITAWAAVSSARGERAQRRETLLRQGQLVRLAPHENGWRQRAWGYGAEAAALRKDDRLRNDLIATLAGVDARLRRSFGDLEAPTCAFDRAGVRLLLGGTNDRVGRHTGPGRLWDGVSDLPSPVGPVGPGPVAFDRDDTPLQLVAREGPAVVLWDVAAGREVGRCRFGGGARLSGFARDEMHCEVLALTPDGTLAAAAALTEGGAGVVAAWEARSGRRLFQAPGKAACLAFSACGSLLAAGGADGRVALWSVRDGQPLPCPVRAGTAVRSLAFGPFTGCRPGEGGPRLEGRLAVGEAGGLVTVWDLRTGLPVAHCRGSDYDVYAVAFSPDGMTLASTGRGPTKLWDAATGGHLLDVKAGDFATGLAFSADGRRLAVSSRRGFGPGAVCLFDLEDGRGTRTLRGLRSQVSKVCFSRDGRWLAALAHNWQVALWDLQAGRLRHVFDVPPGYVADNAALLFSPDGGRFAFATASGARVWEVDTGRQVGAWELPLGLVDTLAYHPSGALMLLRGERPHREAAWTVRLRELRPGEPPRLVREMDDFDADVSNCRPSGDGTLFAFRGTRTEGDHFVYWMRGYDSLTGAERWALRLTGGGQAFAPEPAGRLLAVQPFDDRQGWLLDLSTGTLLGRLGYPPQCLGPGGDWAAATTDGPDQVRGCGLFRARDERPRALLTGASEPNAFPSFSPDGELLAIGNKDGSVSLFHLARLREELRTVGLDWAD